MAACFTILGTCSWSPFDVTTTGYRASLDNAHLERNVDGERTIADRQVEFTYSPGYRPTAQQSWSTYRSRLSTTLISPLISGVKHPGTA